MRPLYLDSVDVDTLADLVASVIVSALDETEVDRVYDQITEATAQYHTGEPGRPADPHKVLLLGMFQTVLADHACARWGAR